MFKFTAEVAWVGMNKGLRGNGRGCAKYAKEI